jgi:hypothetical protein
LEIRKAILGKSGFLYYYYYYYSVLLQIFFNRAKFIILVNFFHQKTSLWLCRYTADRVPTYRLQDKTSSRAFTHALPQTLQLRTSTPCQCGLRRCHMSYGSRPHLPAKVVSDSATCPMALDLSSRLRQALVLPHVLWLWTLPPGQGGS